MNIFSSNFRNDQLSEESSSTAAVVGEARVPELSYEWEASDELADLLLVRRMSISYGEDHLGAKSCTELLPLEALNAADRNTNARCEESARKLGLAPMCAGNCLGGLCNDYAKSLFPLQPTALHLHTRTCTYVRDKLFSPELSLLGRIGLGPLTKVQFVCHDSSYDMGST